MIRRLPCACWGDSGRYYSAMTRLWLVLLLVLPLLGGCMAVIGYDPTDEELEAIRRGEDPRANEGKQPAANAVEGNRQGQGGQPERPKAEAEQPPGPSQGTVLRWMDASTVVIEAENRREVVKIQGDNFASYADESRALDERMNTFTYGSLIRLTYPQTGSEGKPVYRDAEGNLLARIR